MFGRPLIERIAERAAGPYIPPMIPGNSPAPDPFAPAPPSAVAGMFEAGPLPVTVSQATATISRELSDRLKPGDADAEKIFLEWHALREQLEAFLTNRKAAQLGELKERYAQLTKDGRACIDRRQALVNERGDAIGQLNVMEEPFSRLRADFNAIANSSPDNADPDESFALDEERTAWRQSVATAKQKLDAQQALMDPVRAKIERLSREIDAESARLESIKDERRRIRLEAADGVRRIAGSGLGPRVADAR